MQLQLQTFAQLVSSAAAAVQGSARQLIDLTVGSTLRALLEANASMALWLQWLMLQVLNMTRAATSAGPDLDSWMADFGVTRLPAVSSAGVVTFSRFTPGLAGLVPVGTTVRTSDGSQTFSVTEDPSNAAYSPAQNGYVLAAGIASVSVPVAALTAGAAGNVQANTITLITAALSGVDTVGNAAPFQGGLDAESDVALRARFGNFLVSRSRATDTAIGYAIASIQQGLHYVIQENTAPNGAVQMGNFLVTVDDGSGNPSAALLATVAAAVEAMRPVGTTYGVQAPTVVPVSVAMSIATAAGAVHANVAAAVADTVTLYINTLPIGAVLAWSRLAQVAYGASASITNVSAVLLNGGTADIVPPPSGVVKASSVVVS
jgi:uncharacterized phage protein gp47/JayE